MGVTIVHPLDQCAERHRLEQEWLILVEEIIHVDLVAVCKVAFHEDFFVCIV